MTVYSTVQYSTVQYSTVQYSTAPGDGVPPVGPRLPAAIHRGVAEEVLTHGEPGHAPARGAVVCKPDVDSNVDIMQ